MKIKYLKKKEFTDYMGKGIYAKYMDHRHGNILHCKFPLNTDKHGSAEEKAKRFEEAVIHFGYKGRVQKAYGYWCGSTLGVVDIPFVKQFETKYQQNAIPEIEPRVKAGDYVQYIPYRGGRKEYGVVKELAKDGKRAFVWYHSGCTAAGTRLEDLYVCTFSKYHRNVHTGCNQCL